MDLQQTDEMFMAMAIEQAKLAQQKGEVPIGAVVVYDGTVIAQGHNERETKKNALKHAEITAIDKACAARGGWRLFGCTLYVTLEPCPMCCGALINARVDRVVYGAPDPKAGALGSVIDLNACALNHHFSAKGGVLQEECANLLTGFFRNLRKNGKVAK